MRIESRVFLLTSGFLFLAALVYALATKQSANGHGIEPVGVAALILSGGLTLIIGSFFSFVSRRIDARPEDRADAEIAEGAGELGFFSPGSYWPIGIAGAAAITGFGLAFAQIWLVLVGLVAILATVGGLLFEYYVGQNHSTLL